MRDVRVRADIAHGGKPEHIDMTTVLPEIGTYGGADKVEIDYSGNVRGGTTQVGRQPIRWTPPILG